MKIIDRYILTKYLTTFFFCLLLLTAIVVVIDISEKAEDFSLDFVFQLRKSTKKFFLNKSMQEFGNMIYIFRKLS